MQFFTSGKDLSYKATPANKAMSDGTGSSVMSIPSKWIAAIAITTSVAVSGCSYGSKYEAEIACNKWVEKGGVYTEYFDDYEYDFEKLTGKEFRKKEKLPLRYCKEEAETDQFMGFEMKTVREGEIIERDPSKNYGSEITQRFRY